MHLGLANEIRDEHRRPRDHDELGEEHDSHSCWPRAGFPSCGELLFSTELIEGGGTDGKDMLRVYMADPMMAHEDEHLNAHFLWQQDGGSSAQVVARISHTRVIFEADAPSQAWVDLKGRTRIPRALYLYDFRTDEVIDRTMWRSAAPVMARIASEGLPPFIKMQFIGASPEEGDDLLLWVPPHEDILSAATDEVITWKEVEARSAANAEEWKRVKGEYPPFDAARHGVVLSINHLSQTMAMGGQAELTELAVHAEHVHHLETVNVVHQADHSEFVYVIGYDRMDYTKPKELQGALKIWRVSTMLNRDAETKDQLLGELPRDVVPHYVTSALSPDGQYLAVGVAQDVSDINHRHIFVYDLNDDATYDEDVPLAVMHQVDLDVSLGLGGAAAPELEMAWGGRGGHVLYFSASVVTSKDEEGNAMGGHMEWRKLHVNPANGEDQEVVDTHQGGGVTYAQSLQSWHCLPTETSCVEVELGEVAQHRAEAVALEMLGHGKQDPLNKYGKYFEVDGRHLFVVAHDDEDGGGKSEMADISGGVWDWRLSPSRRFAAVGPSIVDGKTRDVLPYTSVSAAQRMGYQWVHSLPDFASMTDMDFREKRTAMSS